eukprot:Plantae.Rhodophyta-Purpureofilum_apyrenoidigerum.ctg6982.p1 GENE.Plantae.Rhodophyta-Purpureofilum_apyrenoidigerum.ctg6982~~Plantae.Rhodophyta-Purpureofilum_apyrenoidigerum.ctg6982.p1  ORF type:complete len:421 (-),score=124.86 Plantae.Rhodophyta-Purpureofilum_apyrenoidigerum.ctg6982:122-1384(-)
MSKEQKPTLGSGAIKTRKRNIQTKSDPEAFRNRILEIFEVANGNEKKQLTLLDNDSLEYQRYGEVFAEIMLAGNMVMPGGSVKENPTKHCVFAAETQEEVKNVIDLFHQLMRRKPFLRTRLDNVMQKLLICGSVFSEKERSNLAYAVALLISRNMLTISVLQKLSTKPSVDSGFSIEFLIRMMSHYIKISNDEIEKLLVLLKNARLDQDAVLEIMPPKDRTQEALNAKLAENNLEKLVEQYEKRKKITKLNELTEGVKDRIDEKMTPSEVYAWVMKQADVFSFSSTEIMYCVWDGLVIDVDASRKAHQKKALLLTTINSNSTLIQDVCKNDADELNLIIRIQNFVSADMELLKSGVFRDVTNLLYQKDILSEDTILTWYRRNSTLNKGSAASSNIIREQMTEFIKWLETADEESEDDDEE